MEEFIHNPRADKQGTSKSLDRKDGENIHTTKLGTVVAKEVTHNLGDSKRVRYLVATYLGGLYDPNGGYSTRERSLDIKLKSVNKATYENYVSYLTTNRNNSFIAAERNFLNGN